MSVSVSVWAGLHLIYDRFDITLDLPLSLCNLFAFIAPLLFWNPDHRRFEVIYFMVMCGTFQAILTPDLYVGFPGYGFFKYWIVHMGLVLVVIHYLLVFKLHPCPKAMITTFIWLNIYLSSLIPVNLWLDANYFYMMEKTNQSIDSGLFWALALLYYGVRGAGIRLFCCFLRTYSYCQEILYKSSYNFTTVN